MQVGNNQPHLDNRSYHQWVHRTKKQEKTNGLSLTPGSIAVEGAAGTFRAAAGRSTSSLRAHKPQCVDFAVLADYALFDQQGKLKAELAELPPKGLRRMSANPHANGGLLLRPLRLPP